MHAKKYHRKFHIDTSNALETLPNALGPRRQAVCVIFVRYQRLSVSRIWPSSGYDKEYLKVCFDDCKRFSTKLHLTTLITINKLQTQVAAKT